MAVPKFKISKDGKITGSRPSAKGQFKDIENLVKLMKELGLIRSEVQIETDAGNYEIFSLRKVSKMLKKKLEKEPGWGLLYPQGKEDEDDDSSDLVHLKDCRWIKVP